MAQGQGNEDFPADAGAWNQGRGVSVWERYSAGEGRRGIAYIHLHRPLRGVGGGANEEPGMKFLPKRM